MNLSTNDDDCSGHDSYSRYFVLFNSWSICSLSQPFASQIGYMDNVDQNHLYIYV